MKEKLAKMGSLQRYNLFANGDFRFGAINQKSKTTYNTIYGYGIDLWYMISAGTETVNANSISVNCDLKYFFEKQLPNGDYTFAISVAGTIYKYTFKGFSGPSKRTNMTVAGKTLGIELINNMFILYANGVTHTIQFMKLEPGTEFTGMQTWNGTIELSKCLPAFTKLNGLRLPASEKNNNFNTKFYAFSLPRSVIMRKVPTITVGGVTDMNTTDGICLRKIGDVSQIVTMTRYFFEVRPWEILLIAYVDNSFDVQNNDVQLFINDNFYIYFDANTY